MFIKVAIANGRHVLLNLKRVDRIILEGPVVHFFYSNTNFNITDTDSSNLSESRESIDLNNLNPNASKQVFEEIEAILESRGLLKNLEDIDKKLK